MSLPHIPDEPRVPWLDDPRCEPEYEEARDDAIELRVQRMLDDDFERELERERAAQ